MKTLEQSRVSRPYHEAVSSGKNRTRVGATLALVIALHCLNSCSDNPGGPPPPSTAAAGFIVSDPVSAVGLATATGATTGPSISAADEVTYVSLTPGTIPTGATAVIQRVGDAASITVALAEGGFDPVPVQAQADDSIEVVVKDMNGVVDTTLRLVVAARRLPVVVRTNPPRKRKDVPLNSALLIVFSEPVAPGTLTASSVQLLRGTTPVAGTVRLLQGTATAAVFEPSALLAPNTDYHLVITEGVRDLENEQLPTTESVDFTTGTALSGAVERVTIAAFDTLIVPVGSQVQLTAVAYDADNHVVSGHDVFWSSQGDAVAIVSGTGLVTAIGPGTATICAEVEGRATCYSFVVSATALPVASIKVSPESSVVLVGLAVQLYAELKDSNGTIVRNRAVVWTSLDPSVAEATGGCGACGGSVTGVAPGVARIEAAVEGKTDTGFVTVQEPAAMVVRDGKPISLVLGEPGFLAAYALDAAGTEYQIPAGEVTWTSSDSAIAVVTINDFGYAIVTGVRAGAALITATWTGHQATANVDVVSLSFASVSTGYQNCGVTVSGNVYCWRTSTGYPARVQGGFLFSAVSVGYAYACGLTTAGAAYCWGDNGLGQLGDGTNTTRTDPVPVSGGHTFAAISAGYFHACGLTPTGEAYCWGGNGFGSLGDGTTGNSNVPVRVSGGFTFATLSAGLWYTCALTANGEAYCWGANSVGQLGDGTNVPRTTPMRAAGTITFSAVSAGDSHTCAVTPSREAYCWGANGAGELGDATTNNRSTPGPVSGGITFADISTGAFGSYEGAFTCGLTPTNSTYCWGYNFANQLNLEGGAGAPWRETVPRVVGGGVSFTRVSARAPEICGVTASGVAYCWGVGIGFSKVRGQP